MVLKRFGFIILAVVVVGYLFGCGKKQQTLEEMQQPMSIEALATSNATTQVAPETKAAESKAQVAQPSTSTVETKLEPLPPSGPYPPTAQEIQTALKNAGYYTGLIDGKVGPMTRKAIEELQKANGLKVDGKVGTKTWAVLKTHLNPPTEPKSKKR